MSMTREEAIIIIERVAHTEAKWPGTEDTLEALDMAVSALRSVSRERIAKMPRCEHCKDGKSFDGQVVIMGNKGMFPLNFCPSCGAPMTDEAVDMMLKRLRVLTNDN